MKKKLDEIQDKIKILFLDDMEDRHKTFKRIFGVDHNVTYVYNHEDCIFQLMNNKFDVVCLDHDLSIESILCDPLDPDTIPETKDKVKEKTGSDVCIEMLDIFAHIEDSEKPMCIVHSLNPVGVKNMMSILKGGGFSVHQFAFHLLVTTPNMFVRKIVVQIEKDDENESSKI